MVTRRIRLVTIGVLCIVGSLTMTRHADAQSAVDRAMILFKEGNVHFNVGEYDLAADKYAAAIRAAPSIPGPYRNIALCYRALKRCDLALPYFRKYLQLKSDGKYAERVRQEIESCAEQTGEDTSSPTPVGAAQLVLRVTEEGAQIHIDSTLRATSPSPAIPLQPGSHTINVFLTGFIPWSTTVELAEGQVLAVDVDLRPDPNYQALKQQEKLFKKAPVNLPPGTIQLMGLPRGAVVSIDERQIALDETFIFRVSPGQHELKITRPGMVTWRQTVNVETKKNLIVSPSLVATQQTRTLRKWGWIMVATAAALGAAGAAVGFIENDSVETIRDYSRQVGTREELDDMVSKQRTQALISNLLFGAASAALGTSVVLFVITPEIEETAAPQKVSKMMLRTKFTF